MLNNSQTNQLIASILDRDCPSLVGRSGILEMKTCFFYSKYNGIPHQLVNLLKNNAGVYGNDIQNFCITYLSSIAQADLNVFWTQDDLKEAQDYVYNNYAASCTRFENRGVEPYYFDEPWSSKLYNKKILVVHPFKKSIEEQFYNKRHLLWKNPNILPSFDLTVYESIQSIGNIGPHSSWTESLNKMKQDIKQINFDIALIGCGAYGLPIGSFIKTEMNRIAIHMGGALQILFGIKGYRWDNHENISQMYNDNWIRPLNNEKPRAYKTIEQGCYW